MSIPLFFNKDESIDYTVLSRYIADLGTQNRITAIYSMAYNTRYRMLNATEVLEVNKEILSLAHKHKLNCFVGHPYVFNRRSLEDYLIEIKRYNPAGISMLYPERYFGIDDPILEFLSIPSKFGLKVILHEMKLVSGLNGELINWPENLLRKAIQLESVIGVKEDSKDDSIAQLVLDECNKKGVTCILAGGGKRRALKFVGKGLKTWLNGSTMFYPKVIDIIYDAITTNQSEIVAFFIENVEKPFFEKVVEKHGWHLAHKTALEYFGYGKRYERFPHPILSDIRHSELKVIFEDIKSALEELIGNDARGSYK